MTLIAVARARVSFAARFCCTRILTGEKCDFSPELPSLSPSPIRHPTATAAAAVPDTLTSEIKWEDTGKHVRPPENDKLLIT